MNWPSPQDYNDAVRKPAAGFADPELAAGDAVVGPNGRPLPHAGDSSVVYEVHAEDDRGWAVKCFTNPVPALAHRYARVREALDWAAAPFAVDFSFLEDGIRVGEQRFPVLKMDWVEGFPLNRVARDRANSPAVMETLFQRWAQLSRELRRAGVAHGDLQHANVLLVPDKWPGSYTLKLIDYDGMYTPALADAPPGEVGHANYQHPARAAEGTYSPDVDRFPLLVVATALKGLSALGPRLWERYDAGDNMLFTAADFRNPAASPLMRELWGTDNPALRALVGRLALACARPIPETPWLDELDAPLTAGEAAAVATALGLDTPLQTASPEPLRLADVFTLDPEPTVAAVRPASARPLIPVEVLALDDEPADDAPRPRANTRRRPEAARTSARPLVLVAAGFLLLAVGVAAGMLLVRGLWPDETAQTTTPADPPANPAPAAPSQPAPVPPAPTPDVTPPAPPQPQPPPFAGPPEFRRVWAKPVADQRGFVKVFVADDGRAVYFATGGRVEAYDARTGAAGVVLKGPGVPFMSTQVWALDRDRVAAFGHPLKSPAVWDAKTGEPLPRLLTADPLPAPDTPVSGAECQLSPDRRYVFIGNQGVTRNGTFGPAQYRVVEVATGKVVAGGEWRFGSARFTADGSRMLMAESTGRVRWVKTATGEVEVEWAFPQIVATHILAGMSADGALINYFGVPAGLPMGNYLLDGKTGQVLRALAHGSGLDRSVVTADGRWVVAILNDPPDHRPAIVVADARTGAALVRTPVGATPNDVVQAAFTPDGRTVVVHDRTKHEIAVYELRGTVPAAPAGMAVPAPLSPIPQRVPPGTPVVGAPPPPPPPPPAPNGGLPAAPALKPRWTVATETGIMANQLPQAALFSKDGRTLVLPGGSTGTILTFDPKTGDAGAAYDGHKGSAGVYWLVPFGGDRVASGGFDAKRATWDTKTGKKVDDVKFPDLPPPPDPMRGHAGITYAVSPGGRYTAAARKESPRPVVAGPLRVLDTTTDKEVLKADWNGGRVLFTADESRVFVLDGLGKAAWYKLPSGEADGEWAAGAGLQAEFARVLGMTADGRTLLYHGPLAGQPVGVYLLDGKTGAVVRKLGGFPYQPTYSALSPDGRYVVTGLIDFTGGAKWYADVFEVATWRVVGRITPPDQGARTPAQFSFSADGKDLVVFYPPAKELSAFPLP